MTDQCILPIHHIEGTIRGKLEIGGAKIQITGDKQVMAIFGGEPGILINDLMLFCPEEADIVINQNIPVLHQENADSIQIQYPRSDAPGWM